jgi:hypothetical protein
MNPIFENPLFQAISFTLPIVALMGYLFYISMRPRIRQLRIIEDLKRKKVSPYITSGLIQGKHNEKEDPSFFNLKIPKKERKTKASTEVIWKMVGDYYNIPPVKLLEPIRKHEVKEKRQIIMYLATIYTIEGPTNIGLFFNKTHATVLHAYKRIRDLQDNEIKLANQIETLRQKIESNLEFHTNPKYYHD